MTSEFYVIDKLLNKLPLDINKLIYSYYDNRCKKCNGEMRECELCNLYYHSYHSCFNHNLENCNICNSLSCPYKKFSLRYCLCDEIIKCEKCFYSELVDVELGVLTEYPSNPERTHTDLYEQQWREGWADWLIKFESLN